MPLPWSDLPFLLALARTGTLSAAAEMLKVDRTTIARRIEQLEEALAEPLFERFDGRYSLTDYGRRVFAAAESAEQDIALLENPADGGRLRDRKVRVSLSEHLLITLAGYFHGFTQAHPNPILELTATDRIVDLKHFETDVALRMSRTEPRDLETRRIGKPVFALYRRRGCNDAGNRYIARPSEERVPGYLLRYAPRAELAIAVDGLVSMRELIAQGLGVGILPRYFGDRDCRIECCSGPLPNAGFVMFIVLRPEQRKLHRIKMFVDHVEAFLRHMPGIETGVSPTAELRSD